MEMIEQTAYVEGVTENCKDLITKSNRILAEMGTDKVLKMRRGIEQEFVDVVVEGKRLSEDWEDTKTIFSITFYDMLNKYLFDKEVQGVFVKHEDFVKTTMQREGARLNEIIYFLVNNYLIKQTGEAPKPEVPRLEGHPDSVKSYSPEQVVEVEDKIIKVFVDEDGDSIVTYESGRKVVVSKNKGIPQSETVYVQPEKINQVPQKMEQGAVHNHAPNKEVMGNEAIVSAHEEDTINQSSNNQNINNMIRKTKESDTTTVAGGGSAVPTMPSQKKYSTSGEVLIGSGLATSDDESAQSVIDSFADMADYLLEIEQTEAYRSDVFLQEFTKHAKQSILTASMSMVRVVTYKK